VGDTLFKGSCGRTDLPGGNSVHLKESLRLLKKLPANTDVYSGHGDSTTLQHENETNFYMQ
jgi:glyoxylase-like metal-dependent hydrolase (beta-lactamase superfamily II)